MPIDIHSSHQIYNHLVEDIKKEYLSSSQNYPWILGFSGGKDSTLVAHLVFEAILNVAPSQRKRHIHIVSNDTLVESPLVMSHLHKVQEQMRHASNTLDLPITVATTKPIIHQSFWVLLIGKGYPTPNQTMRWCTDRLKIQPTSGYILDKVSAYGAAILILGVRKDESNSRKRNIDKYQNIAESNLTPHSTLSGAYIYRPIVDLSTDDVWELLAEHSPAWGGTHRDLIQLYRDAEGGECPVVMSKEDAPGCGTNSSRFGCWTCTVVEKDKSLQGFVDSGMHKYSKLIDFRDWLKMIRNNPEFRQVERRNGRVQFDSNGNHIPGPFTVEARRMILNKLLETQDEYGEELISPAEIELIRREWSASLTHNINRRRNTATEPSLQADGF
ncbi:MAG: DNA phosphorothioation system sulfurtransferase DndC [Methylococcus sp.]